MLRTIVSPKRLDMPIKTVAVLAVIYHLGNVYFSFHTATEYLNTHLFFALVVAGLSSLKKWPKLWPLWLLFLAICIVSCGYVHFNYRVLEIRGGYPTTPDMFIGITLVVVSIIGSWWAFGVAIPILIILFIGYAVFGFLIPGYFSTYPPEFPRLISHLSIGLQGVYGIMLSASAYTIFLFILFGGILQVTPAMDFFMEMGRLVARGTRGGAAHISVVSSALFGMISGSSAANVAVDGVVTIPFMKRAGYPPEQAGAVEASASNGGQIMPPIMGASAFVMAELTGVDYFKICIAAFLPAAFYFVCVGIGIELRARKIGLAMQRTPVDWRRLLLASPVFIIPLAVMIGLLSLHYSANLSVFWAIIALLVISFIRERGSLSLSKLIDGFENGVRSGFQIAMICAGLGILYSVMTTSGLAVKLPKFVEMGSQGNIWLALILTMFISLILGCGLPTLPAYLIVAIVTAPVLVEMGIPLIAVHLACMYFAVFAMVTPPVAPAALVAAGIANSNFIKTALEALKLSVFGLVLPFLWVANPTLLGNLSDPLLVLMTIVGVIFLLVAMNTLFVGFYFVKLKPWERTIAALSSIGLGLSVALANYPLFAIGALLFVTLTIGQLHKSKREQERGGM